VWSNFFDYRDEADIEGVAMKNMIWFIPDETGQPVGPYCAEQITEWLITARIPQTTLCWREGMEDWRPLSQVQPFCDVLPDTYHAPKIDEAEVQRFDDLGKIFGKAVNLTKKKAKIVSLKMSIGRHEKRQQELLFELGKMLYEKENGSQMLTQLPYVEKVCQIRAEDESIHALRKEIEAIENAGSVNP
jgi:hypothetical protein